jgi:hypothetical protein
VKGATAAEADSMGAFMRAAWGGAAALAMLLAASGARAEPSTADKTTARVLFDEARALQAAGKYAEACPKFEESARLDPGAGSTFNLAHCWEQMGRTASAWTLFLEVASKMRAEGQADREKAARQRAAVLEPTLNRVSVVVPDTNRVAGLVVRRDGAELAASVWGTPIPVDPGQHVIEASAPGKKKWSRIMQVAGTATRIVVEVPKLDDEGAAAAAPSPIVSPVPSAPQQPAPAPATPAMPAATEPVVPPPAPTQDAPATTGGTQRTVGLVLAAAGVLGLGAGGAIGLAAKSKFNDASGCNGNQCTQGGYDTRNDARSLGNVASVVMGIGAVALVGGVVVYLIAPRGNASEKRATATLSMGPSSLLIAGSW